MKSYRASMQEEKNGRPWLSALTGMTPDDGDEMDHWIIKECSYLSGHCADMWISSSEKIQQWLTTQSITIDYTWTMTDITWIMTDNTWQWLTSQSITIDYTWTMTDITWTMTDNTWQWLTSQSITVDYTWTMTDITWTMTDNTWQWPTSHGQWLTLHGQWLASYEHGISITDIDRNEPGISGEINF